MIGWSRWCSARARAQPGHDGRTVEVMVERASKHVAGEVMGRTRGHKPVNFPSAAVPGDLVLVELSKLHRRASGGGKLDEHRGRRAGEAYPALWAVPRVPQSPPPRVPLQRRRPRRSRRPLGLPRSAKTAVAAAVARSLGVRVISFDSMQVYQAFVCSQPAYGCRGTGGRACLVGFLDPSSVCSAAVRGFGPAPRAEDGACTGRALLAGGYRVIPAGRAGASQRGAG